MADGIELALGAISLVIGLVLVIVVVYRWAREKDREEKFADIVSNIKEFQGEKSTQQSELTRIREGLGKLSETLTKELKEMQASMNDLRNELEVTKVKQNETIEGVDGVKSKMSEVERQLHAIEKIAREARRFSHEHALLGSPV